MSHLTRTARSDQTLSKQYQIRRMEKKKEAISKVGSSRQFTEHTRVEGRNNSLKPHISINRLRIEYAQ